MEKERTLRILHTGDIHLDSPFSRLSLSESEERRSALWNTFSAMLAYVREKEIDIALLTGDIFDSAYVTAATATRLCEAFSACPRCRFFISPGNHDPFRAGSLYAAGRLPDNVHVFSEESLSAVSLPALDTTVWGWAFTADRYEGAPLAGRRADGDGLHLICGHADLFLPLTKYASVSEADLASFGAHYAAFGHRHLPGEPGMAGNCRYAYCGCLESRSFDEPGIGGAWLLTAQKADGAWQITQQERLQFSPRRYAIETLDLTGLDSVNELAGRMKQRVHERGYDEHTALRILFVGATAPQFTPPTQADPRVLGLYYLELIDRTAPTYDTSYLASDLSVRGELYRSLLPKLTGGSEKERATAARALRMGLAALEGNPITDI